MVTRGFMNRSSNLTKRSSYIAMQNMAYQRLRTGKGMGNIPKRMFNKNFDRKLNSLLEKLPQGNIGYAIVGLNTLFYLLQWIWPPGSFWQF